MCYEYTSAQILINWSKMGFLMSKINILNNLRCKLKSFLSVVAVFCLLVISSQAKTYPHIPLKGLFNVLKYDDIGFAHALLHSKWIENVYQYAEGKPYREVKIKKSKKNWMVECKDDAVANLVRKLWFRASENHQLLPTQFGYVANIPSELLGSVFGKLINYVYGGCGPARALRPFDSAQGRPSQDERVLIDELFAYDSRAARFNGELSALLRKLAKEQEKLEAEKFCGLPEATKKFRQGKKKLEKEFDIKIFKQQLKQAKKKKRKNKKGFKEKEKKLRELFKVDLFDQKVKKEESESFLSFAQEVRDARGEYKKIARVVQECQDKIKAKIHQKCQMVKKALFNPICQAVKLCKTNKRYDTRTVEAILWALFLQKVDNLISLEEKVAAINACLGQIDQAFKSERFCNGEELKKLYDKKDFDIFEDDLAQLEVGKQIDTVFANYDVGLHYFINFSAAGKLPPVIIQGNYGYEYEKGECSHTRPNCHESALLDMLSILWYNQKTNRFDNALFPEKIIQNGKGFKRLSEALKYFYLADKKGIRADEYICTCQVSEPDGKDGELKNVKFTSLAKLKQLGKISAQEVKELSISEVPVSYMVRSEIKQEFFNIVSGIPGVIYCSSVAGKGKIFEVKSGVNNMLRVCNYLYGTQVESIDELGDKDTGLSTGDRKVSFAVQDQDQLEEGVANTIKIGVNDRKYFVYFDMTVQIKPGHTYLSVGVREQKDFQVLKEDFAKSLFIKTAANCPRRLAVLAMFSAQKLLEEKKIKWSLPVSNIVYYTLAIKRPEVALEIIKDILVRHPEYYDNCQEMVCNLIEQIPDNDPYLKDKLTKIIINSKFHEKEFFQKFIIDKVLGDPEFYRYKETVEKIFQLALKCKYEKIALVTIDNPKFTSWGHALNLALQKDDKNIALAIVKKPRFNAAQHRVGRVLVFALQNQQYSEIAKKILENPSFTCWEEAVGFALVQGNYDIVSQLLEHPRCNFSCSGVEYGLLYALRKGNENIVLKVLRHDAFDFTKNSMGAILKVAMAKGHASIIEEIIKQPTLNVKSLYFERAMWDALRNKKYKYVALAIAQNSTFNVSDSSGIKNKLKCALNRGYAKVALAIIQNPQVNLSSDGFNSFFQTAVECGCQEVALAMMKHPLFDMKGYSVRNILGKALKHGYKELFFALVNHPEFSLWGDAIESAMKAKHQDIVSMVMKHARFNPNNIKHLITRWLTSEQKEYMDIALAVVNHPEFDVSKENIDSILVASLQDKAYEDIALSIMQNPDFNRWKSVLEKTLKEGFIACSPQKFDSNTNQGGQGLYKEDVPDKNKRYHGIGTDETKAKANRDRLNDLNNKNRTDAANKTVQEKAQSMWGFVPLVFSSNVLSKVNGFVNGQGVIVNRNGNMTMDEHGAELKTRQKEKNSRCKSKENKDKNKKAADKKSFNFGDVSFDKNSKERKELRQKLVKLRCVPEYKNAAIAIVSHEKFDAHVSWVAGVLSHIKDLVQKHSECRQELYEVIDAIKTKRGRAKIVI